MPRDTARIPAILEALKYAWETNPDQRLTQLIRNATTPTGSMDSALYNLEDEELLRGLHRLTEHYAGDRIGRIGGDAQPVWIWDRELHQPGTPLGDAVLAWAVEQGLPILEIALDVPPDIIGADGNYLFRAHRVHLHPEQPMPDLTDVVSGTGPVPRSLQCDHYGLTHTAVYLDTWPVTSLPPDAETAAS